MLDGFACWRRQPVQIHEGRCVAVDMVLLEVVSEKILQSIRDLSMVVWPQRELWRGREVEVVAFDHVVATFTDPAKRIWGRCNKGPS